MSAREPLILGSEENSFNSQISELVLAEAYRRAGIPVTFVHYPSLRSLVLTNDGMMDGQVNRVAGIEEEYSNLVMVPVVINRFTFYAFTLRNQTLALVEWDWESLRPYRLVSRRGIKIVEYRTEGMNIESVTDWSQVPRLVEAGRYDIGVIPYITALEIIGESKLSAVVPNVPLENIELFHFLHKNHADLVPVLSEILEEMEREGRIQAIKEQFVARHLGDLSVGTLGGDPDQESSDVPAEPGG